MLKDNYYRLCFWETVPRDQYEPCALGHPVSGSGVISLHFCRIRPYYKHIRDKRRRTFSRNAPFVRTNNASLIDLNISHSPHGQFHRGTFVIISISPITVRLV
jgi:hypothetical protein